VALLRLLHLFKIGFEAVNLHLFKVFKISFGSMKMKILGKLPKLFFAAALFTFLVLPL
jgi:hypothetical protein